MGYVYYYIRNGLHIVMDYLNGGGGGISALINVSSWNDFLFCFVLHDIYFLGFTCV